MTKPRSSPASLFQEYPFGILLAALFVIIIGAPMTSQLSRHLPFLRAEVAISPFVLILTLAAARAIAPVAKSRATAIVLGGFVLTFLSLSTVFHHKFITASHLVGQVAFLIYVIAVTTRVVFRAPVVDGNILCGAASIYLLIGVLAGFLYSLIDLILPGSFAIIPPGSVAGRPTDHADAGWMIYFSFTTLTTVGFGDVLPANEVTRSLAVLEAVVGQILLVVMMARLVGLHVAQVSSHKAHSPVVFETGEKGKKS